MPSYPAVGGVSTSDSPTWTGTHTFSEDVTLNGGTGALGFGAGETIVPADGTLNVTGHLVVAGDIRTNDAYPALFQFPGANDYISSSANNEIDIYGSGVAQIQVRSAAGSSSTLAGDWLIDGNEDRVQLTVQGHSTQTALPFVVENSAGTDVFTVSNTGVTTASSTVIAPTHAVQSGLAISGGTSAVPGNLEAACSDGASAVAWIINNGATFSTAGAKQLSVRNNNVEKAYVDLNGSFRSVTGGLAANVASVKTTDYTATAADFLIPVDVATTGDVAITLPAANAAKGQILMIKATSLHVTRDININRAGADTITTSTATGATTLQLSPTATYNAVVLLSDGTSVWYVINLM